MLKCLYIVDSFTLEWFVLDEQIDGGNKQEWWDWEDSTQGSKHATHHQITKGGVKKNTVFIHILWIRGEGLGPRNFEAFLMVFQPS